MTQCTVSELRPRADWDGTSIVANRVSMTSFSSESSLVCSRPSLRRICATLTKHSSTTQSRTVRDGLSRSPAPRRRLCILRRRPGAPSATGTAEQHNNSAQQDDESNLSTHKQQRSCEPAARFGWPRRAFRSSSGRSLPHHHHRTHDESHTHAISRRKIQDS
jgi:hypothetical protein